MAKRKCAIEKALDGLPPDAPLKVGAKTSYFYAGTVGDFLEHLDDYSKCSEKRADRNAAMVQKRIEIMRRNGMEPPKELTSQREKFVPFRSRAVRSLDKSDNGEEDGGWNLLIEGEEQGNYWMHREARRRRSKLSFGEEGADDE